MRPQPLFRRPRSCRVLRFDWNWGLAQEFREEAAHMPPLRILEQPELREPTLIAAFAGWSDAGSAATAAAQYLVDRWHAQPLAEFEAEEFYDFTQLRPTVKYTEGTYRKIIWPQNTFSFHQTPERDLIIFN